MNNENIAEQGVNEAINTETSAQIENAAPVADVAEAAADDMLDFDEPSDREWEEEEEEFYEDDLREMDLKEYLPLDWRM